MFANISRVGPFFSKYRLCARGSAVPVSVVVRGRHGKAGEVVRTVELRNGFDREFAGAELCAGVAVPEVLRTFAAVAIRAGDEFVAGDDVLTVSGIFNGRKALAQRYSPAPSDGILTVRTRSFPDAFAR